MRHGFSGVALFRLLMALWLGAAGARWVAAQEMYVLAFQAPGQATVILDDRASRLFVIDLGKASQGKTLRIEDQTLQEVIEARDIREAVFICSHPHSDHMGGIRALFETTEFLFIDGDLDRPRFRKITVIEQDVPNSLKSILETVIPRDKAAFVSTRGLSGGAIGSVSDAVVVEPIPYEAVGAPGPHGRAIVSLITLEGRYVVLDPDDADSVVVKQVADKLAARGIQINAFVVPHHGSRYQDIQPLLDLKPQKAIISVNARNQYGHPAPEILVELINRLGRENVLFTGSVSNIKLGPDGVIEAKYSAGNPESYAMFVEPSRRRLAQRGELPDQLVEAYEQARTKMQGGLADMAEANDTLLETLGRRIASTGTIHSTAFEAGYDRGSGVNLSEVQERRVFRGRSVTAPVVYTPETVENSGLAEQHLRTTYLFDRAFVGSDSEEIIVRKASMTGVENGLEPAQRIQRGQLDALVTGSPAGAAAKPPAGGMVWITGDRLVTTRAAGVLVGSTIDVCGETLCFQTVTGEIFGTSFKVDLLFEEVWRRVYERGIDTFYLSINPTHAALSGDENLLISAPDDRLYYGVEQPRESYANEVVTAGDIANSEIGRILWEADVAFKSASLGFDVLTGASRDQRRSTPPGLAAGQIQFFERDLEVDQGERWCRLYWSSGLLRLAVDQEKRQVLFTGEPVEARAEPMQLTNGELHDNPAGGWCEDAKAIAAELQRQSNEGSASNDSISELARLAALQALVRWARENSVSPAANLLEKISEMGKYAGQPVPTWTTGVRSRHKVLIQQERASGPGEHHLELVHVSFAEAATFEECMRPAWNMRWTDFPKKGFRYNESTRKWEGVLGTRYLRRWMSKLARSIAECSSGTLLPENGVLAVEDSFAEAETTSFGLVPHVQPVQYHGGVFLGEPVAQPFLATAVEQGFLNDLEGHRVFERDGDDLHFWRTSNPQEAGVLSAQHIVFRGGSILDARAVEGRLRFLVEVAPGGVVRREFRGQGLRAFPKGLEWADAMQGDDGAVVIAHGAWPCLGESSECIRAAHLGFEDLRVELGDEAQVVDGIECEWLEDSTWLVDLDISPTREILDQRWAEVTSLEPAAALGLVKAYENWGFTREAASKAEWVLETIERNGQDAVLDGGVFRSLKMARADADLSFSWGFMELVVEGGLSTGELAPSQVLDSIFEVEKVLHAWSELAKPYMWRDLEEWSQEIMDREDLDPEVLEEAAGARMRYASRALHTAALAIGVLREEHPRDWLQTGFLASGESVNRTIEINSEQDGLYVVRGWCSLGCGDLDLVVVGSDGRLLGIDEEPDAQPVVVVEAPDLEQIDVKIVMHGCENERCHFALSAEPYKVGFDDILAIAALDEDSEWRDLPIVGDDDTLLSEGSLATGDEVTVEVELQKDVQYRIFGECNGSCTELKLRLLGVAGELLAENSEQTDFPVINITPVETTTFSLEIGMTECSAETCVYEVMLELLPTMEGELGRH